MNFEALIAAIFGELPSEYSWRDADVDVWGMRCIRCLGTLSLRESLVLIGRFGTPERTLKEVGAELGVTRESIRQIQAKALRKLRHPSRSKYIRGQLTYAQLIERADPLVTRHDIVRLQHLPKAYVANWS